MATNVAELVTHLHTNIDSIHKCIETLSDTHAHDAELDRLTQEREAKIAALRLRHEADAAELQAQRQQEAAAVAEQRKLEEESLAVERKREEEEIAARRKREDDERAQRVLKEEAERERKKAEEDEAREREKAEWENQLQEQVEAELERLEDEMEKRVEEGRRALAELDEKRKSINAQIDAALNGGTVPPIKFRSRAKTGMSSRPVSLMSGLVSRYVTNEKDKGIETAVSKPAPVVEEKEQIAEPELARSEEERREVVADRVEVDDTASETTLHDHHDDILSHYEEPRDVKEDPEDVRAREEMAAMNAEFARLAMEEEQQQNSRSIEQQPEPIATLNDQAPRTSSELDGAWWSSERKIGTPKLEVQRLQEANLSDVREAPTEFDRAWWTAPRVNTILAPVPKARNLLAPNLSDVQQPHASTEFDSLWWETARVVMPDAKPTPIAKANLSEVQEPHAETEFNPAWWSTPRVETPMPIYQPRSIAAANLSAVQQPHAPSEFHSTWWMTPREIIELPTMRSAPTCAANLSDVQAPPAPTEFTSTWWSTPRVSAYPAAPRAVANLSAVQSPPAPTEFDNTWWNTPRPSNGEANSWWDTAKAVAMAPIVGVAVAATVVGVVVEAALPGTDAQEPSRGIMSTDGAHTEFTSEWWTTPRELQAYTEFDHSWWISPRKVQQQPASPELDQPAFTEFTSAWWNAPRVLQEREAYTEFTSEWWNSPRVLQEQAAKPVETEFHSVWWNTPREVVHAHTPGAVSREVVKSGEGPAEVYTEFNRSWWTAPRVVAHTFEPAVISGEDEFSKEAPGGVYTEFDRNWWTSPREVVHTFEPATSSKVVEVSQGAPDGVYTEFDRNWWISPREVGHTFQPASVSREVATSRDIPSIVYTEHDQDWWLTPRVLKILEAYTEFDKNWWTTPREVVHTHVPEEVLSRSVNDSDVPSRVYTEFDNAWWHSPRVLQAREAYTEFDRSWWTQARVLAPSSSKITDRSIMSTPVPATPYTEFNKQWWTSPRILQEREAQTEFHTGWWNTPRERHPLEIEHTRPEVDTREVKESVLEPELEMLSPTVYSEAKVEKDVPVATRSESETSHYFDFNTEPSKEVEITPDPYEDPEDRRAREEIAEMMRAIAEEEEALRSQQNVEQERSATPISHAIIGTVAESPATVMNADKLFEDSDEVEEQADTVSEELPRLQRPVMPASLVSSVTQYDTAEEGSDSSDMASPSPDFEDAEEHPGQQAPRRASGMFASLVSTIRTDVPIVSRLIGGQEYQSVAEDDADFEDNYSREIDDNDTPVQQQSTNSLREGSPEFTWRSLGPTAEHPESDEEFPSRHNSKGLRLRTDTTGTVPSFENFGHSDAEESPATPSDASTSPFMEHPPNIRDSWSPPRQTHREVQQDLKPQASPRHEQFDPYNAPNFAYITPKSSTVDLKSEELAISQAALRVSTPTADASTSTDNTTSCPHPLAATRSLHSPTPPSPSSTRIPRRPTLTDRSSRPAPTTINPNSSSFFQKTRSLFESTPAPSAAPKTVRPRSGVFHVPAPHSTPSWENSRSRARPNSMYSIASQPAGRGRQSSMSVSFVSPSLAAAGDGAVQSTSSSQTTRPESPSPAFALPTAASLNRISGSGKGMGGRAEAMRARERENAAVNPFLDGLSRLVGSGGLDEGARRGLLAGFEQDMDRERERGMERDMRGMDRNIRDERDGREDYYSAFRPRWGVTDGAR